LTTNISTPKDQHQRIRSTSTTISAANISNWGQQATNMNCGSKRSRSPHQTIKKRASTASDQHQPHQHQMNAFNQCINSSSKHWHQCYIARHTTLHEIAQQQELKTLGVNVGSTCEKQKIYHLACGRDLVCSFWLLQIFSDIWIWDSVRHWLCRSTIIDSVGACLLWVRRLYEHINLCRSTSAASMTHINSLGADLERIWAHWLFRMWWLWWQARYDTTPLSPTVTSVTTVALSPATVTSHCHHRRQWWQWWQWWRRLGKFPAFCRKIDSLSNFSTMWHVQLTFAKSTAKTLKTHPNDK
jgi:hypothetical protein